ncbi:MAG: restriction endonuclease [Candidatus Aenigmatarchaeota archaeon]|nr:restriction endonuclease [Candidatus Aenigmarchaeota archaeon]
MLVTKFDGRKEEFQKDKIINTCIRAGVSQEIAVKIANEIESKAYNEISTKEIYQMIKKLLEKYETASAKIYTLREAIASLDPFIFEIFIKRLLESYEYICEYNKIIQGLAVEHQIDIIARNKMQELILVECKRHRNAHRFCGLDTCLQVYATLEDILDGFKNNKNNYNFKKAWIITNTKFSEHAKKYANAKDIILTGWKYPENASLEFLIQKKALYPVNILKTKKNIIEKIMQSGIIVVKELEEDKLREIGMSENIIRNLIKQKEDILSKGFE